MIFFAGFLLGLVSATCAAIAAFDYLRDEVKELRIIREDLTQKLSIAMGHLNEISGPKATNIGPQIIDSMKENYPCQTK